MPGTLFTLGYGKARGVPEFTQLLDGNHIDVLFDVRYNPMSRNPLWRSTKTTEMTVMRSGLVDVYRWNQGLGNPDYKSGKVSVDYADKSQLPEVLVPLEAGLNVGIMCYCEHTAKCHRRHIVRDVQEAIPGIRVVELELPEDPR